MSTSAYQYLISDPLFFQINGNNGDKRNSPSSSLKHLAAVQRSVETPDTAFFPLFICIGANTWATLKCFRNLPHHNKQGYTGGGKTFSAHLFAFGELPRPNSTASALLSASASHYQHEKVKEMCCHGYMVCHLYRRKNICVSPSFVSVFFTLFFLQACLLFQLLFMPLTWEGSVLYITLEQDPPRFVRRIFIPL